MNNVIKNNRVISYSKDELSLKKVITLVLIPAVSILMVFNVLAYSLKDYVPVFLCLLVPIGIVLIPIEIGIIMKANKKLYGSLGVKAAFKRHEHLNIVKVILMAILLFAWAGLVFTLLQPLENSLLINNVFKFLPSYLYSTNFSAQLARFPKWIILITCILNLVFNGILGPITEELYFRGYLMSRLERFGNKAPIIITVIFSLYHLFSPWENVTRIIALLPMHICVWKYKNLYIGMLTHCACNMVGVITLFSLLYK